MLLAKIYGQTFRTPHTTVAIFGWPPFPFDSMQNIFRRVGFNKIELGSSSVRRRHRHQRTMCPEGDFLVKIKFIENRIIEESLVDPIYAEFHEQSIKLPFKTLK